MAIPVPPRHNGALAPAILINAFPCIEHHEMTSRRTFMRGALAVTSAALVPTRRTRAAEDFRFSTNPFPLGVASGYPTPDSMVLWTRLTLSPLEPGGGMPQEVVAADWEVATDDRMRSVIQHGTTYATPEWAHSVHI
ncbi:MAG TPA: PhoD-like phosphatase N-terminal domain-containing protein, partial [Steroidobacteraceae bacterium]